MTTPPAASLFHGKNIVIVAAHPDDETLFASSALLMCKTVTVVHLTDGATNQRSAKKNGFASRALYAAARHQEFLSAISAGRPDARYERLGYRDQTATYNMAKISARLETIIAGLNPDLVLTHAYEGAHLDHDAACFTTYLAIRRARSPCMIMEFAGYLVQDGRSIHGAFSNDNGAGSVKITLTAAQQADKLRMLACYKSQMEIINKFQPATECFRYAPRYDFGQAPFSGRLGYEAGGNNEQGRLWRALAVAETEAPKTGFTGLCRVGVLKLKLRLSFKISRLKRKFLNLVYGGDVLTLPFGPAQPPHRDPNSTGDNGRGPGGARGG